MLAQLFAAALRDRGRVELDELFHDFTLRYLKEAVMRLPGVRLICTPAEYGVLKRKAALYAVTLMQGDRNLSLLWPTVQPHQCIMSPDNNRRLQ